MDVSKRRRVRSCCEAGVGSSLLLQGIEVISRVPLFASLPPAELPRIASVLRNVVYQAGQVVLRRDDPGHRLLIIQSGRAVVRASRPQPGPDGATESVEELWPGDFYGVSAVLRGAPLSVTIEAAEELTLWELERSDFERLGLRHRLHFQKRSAVHEVEATPDLEATEQPCEKSEALVDFLLAAMLDNQTMAPLLEHLSDQDARAIVSSACLKQFEKGAEIVCQGETEMQHFYIVEKGQLEVCKDGRIIRTLGPGSTFGELALLFWQPRSSTVKALSAARLWAVPRGEFRKITQGPLRSRLDEYAALLARIPGLSRAAAKSVAAAGMDGAAWRKLADVVEEMVFFRGELVVEAGEDDRRLYVLHEGRLAVEGADGGTLRELVGEPSTGRGDFFGERALLEEAPHEASVRVLGDRARVVALDRRALRRRLQLADTGSRGPAQAALAKRPSIIGLKAPRSGARGGASRRCSCALEDLEEVGVLGWGSYAKVTLVRCACKGATYALKSISKGRILQRRQVKQVQTERLVLKTVSSDFVVDLVKTFRTDTHLSFLMEPAMGGDLCTVLERQQLYYSPRHSRFYVACAAQGLEHLHERWIVNRDLKLENMLLDANGYCKLADFGLAKFVIGHTFTLCGTPDYMAPEVITGRGHTRAVDWWALGVALYALMAGIMPFDAPMPAQIFAKAKRGIEPVLAMTGFGGDADDWTDVVKGLCKSDPSERLPARKGGVANLRQHRWWAKAHFDWRELCDRTMRPPYFPIVEGSADLSNFDPNPEDAPRDVMYFDPGDDWDVDFDESAVRSSPHSSGLGG